MPPYFKQIAAAFVRGRCLQGDLQLADELRTIDLHRLTVEQLDCILQSGLAAGLKLHKFKRTMGLPRVRRVFGVLRSIAPASLLDVGSGRGAFLWPLMDEFPRLPVTAMDARPDRARDLDAVRLGGLERLSPCQMDVTEVQFEDHAFDAVTMLEVLEHVEAAQRALAGIVRVARRFVILSVPSQPDDNPEHIHLFDQPALRRMFNELGVQRLTFDYVRSHMLVVANVGAR